MTMHAKPVRGSVRILRCDKCCADFPIFDYEVEYDTDTVGLYSAGKCGGKSLLLVAFTLEEWRAAKAGSLRELPLRFSPMFDQAYRLTHILRVEEHPMPPAGGSFSEFRKHYKPPTVVYSCPCCGEGEAVTRTEIAPGDFVKTGGKVIAVEPLMLIP